MSLMTWTPQYTVHIRRFDEDHQKLFDIIKELDDGIRAGRPTDELESMLTKLLCYTRDHFSREEEAMKGWGYPNTRAHMMEHAAFVARVNGFYEQYKGGAAAISVKLTDLLTQWLTVHIDSCDKQYSNFLNAHGVN